MNNDGGGIFGHLPIAQFEPPFEEFFATPQKVDFAKLANAEAARTTLRGLLDLDAPVTGDPDQAVA